MSKPKKNLKFEESLEKLEGIITNIETGSLPLEDSLKAFEEGIGLVGYCEDLLTAAEGHVDILLKSRDGTSKEEPFHEHD